MCAAAWQTLVRDVIISIKIMKPPVRYAILRYSSSQIEELTFVQPSRLCFEPYLDELLHVLIAHRFLVPHDACHSVPLAKPVPAIIVVARWNH